jgi:sugar phosphate permease
MAITGLRRLLGGSTRLTCVLLSVLGAGALAVLAGPDVLGIAAVGFAAYYVAHGSAWPLLSAVLHTRVSADFRATAVSAMSLAMALGGICANAVIPWLAQRFSTDAAFLVVAAVVLASTAACLGLPRATTEEPSEDDALESAEHLVAGTPGAAPAPAAPSTPRNARDTRPN